MNRFESILARLKQSFGDRASTLEGTVVGDVLQAVANELARIYSQELEEAQQNLYLHAARGARLEALCANYSILRGENESDEALRQRALRQIRCPALAGNAAQYEAWAAAVPGVRAVRAVAGVQGPGTVDVYYVPTEDAVAELWEQLQAHLEANCPLGAEVLALEAMDYSLSVNAAVALKDIAVIEEVQAAYQAALEAYFAEIALTEAGMRISPNRLATMLMEVPGVLDVRNLTINGKDNTQILPEGSYPQLAELRVSEVLVDG